MRSRMRKHKSVTPPREEAPPRDQAAPRLRVKEICAELDKLGASGVLSLRAVAACHKAASVLRLLEDDIRCGLRADLIGGDIENYLADDL